MLAYSVPVHPVARTVPNGWNSVCAIEKRFLRIARELCKRWQSDEIDDYIDSLLLDDRGDRMGFPIDVLDELMFLAGIRWHVLHLCGTVIQTTTAEHFDFTGNTRQENYVDPKTWVLI